MTPKELHEFHASFCDKMGHICKSKGQDYSGETDPFANFKAVELLGISVEHGFLTRIMDKVMRISNLTDGREPAVLDEKIEDTLTDLANYAILMAGYIRSKNEEVEHKHKYIVYEGPDFTSR
jgi:hypothetical protein